MLQTIREYTQGWIAGTIISIIILSFALWGIHSYFEGGGGANKYVADVNGIEITKEQLSVAYERLRRQVQIQYSSNNPLTSKDESALKSRAMQSLIDMEVLKQASTSQGYRVSDRQIDNYLQSMPEFQINGQFSLQRFQEVLSSTLLSTSEFLELIRTSLLIEQPRIGLVSTSFSLPDETAQTITLINQERDLEYITIPMQYFLTKITTIPSEKILAYYEQNKSEFMTPEQASVEYIQLSLKDLTSKINPTDVILKNFYEENINSYTKPTQWKLALVEFPITSNINQNEQDQLEKTVTTAYQAIKNGDDLSKAATQYNGKLSNKNWMSLTDLPDDLQKPVADLINVGDISSPIKTSKSWVIVKVIDKQEPKMQTFDEAKDKVKEVYIRQRSEEKFAELRDQLADLTYEHPESLQYAANTLNVPIQTSELFTKDKAGKDVSQFKKVRDSAFSNDVMNLQNNSDVIQVNPETLVVLRIKSHVASALLPLTEISHQIEVKLKAKEAEVQAEKFAEELKAKLEAGAKLHELANTHQFKWFNLGLTGRYSTKVDNAILDLGFRIPNPETAKSKVTYGVTRLPNGYAIVALKSVKAGKIADNKQESVYTEQLQNSDGLLEYELYKLSQTNTAKISIQQ